MPLMIQPSVLSNRSEVLRLLASGECSFKSLHLEKFDGVKINFSNCNLIGSRFKAARFGHANFSNAISRVLFRAIIAMGSSPFRN